MIQSCLLISDKSAFSCNLPSSLLSPLPPAWCIHGQIPPGELGRVAGPLCRVPLSCSFPAHQDRPALLRSQWSTFFEKKKKGKKASVHNASMRKSLHFKHSPYSDVLQAECCSGNRQALGAEILRVERLKCCLQFDWVVPSSLVSLSTCKEEKGNKAFTPWLTSSLFLCWTQAEGEGNLE